MRIRFCIGIGIRPAALLLLGLFSATFALAQTRPPAPLTLTAAPQLVRVAGAFYPADGVAAPTASAVLAIYAQETGGVPLWQETQTVALDGNANYVVLLGATRPDGLPMKPGMR